jgi:TonB family protein
MRLKFAAFVLAVMVLSCHGASSNLVADDFAQSMHGANDFIRQGEYENAIREYEQALRCKKHSIAAQSWLGIAYERWGDRLFKDGDSDRAIDAYRKALTAVPTDAFWHEQLGIALEKKGDDEAAMKEFRSATELLPLDDGLKSKYEEHLGKPQASGDTGFGVGKSVEHIETVGGGVTTPIPIYKPDPPYSERARQAKLGGWLDVWFVVDREGNVVNMAIVNPLGLGLDAMALETVRTWKFHPATRDGKAVPVRVKVTLSFSLL